MSRSLRCRARDRHSALERNGHQGYCRRVTQPIGSLGLDLNQAPVHGRIRGLMMGARVAVGFPNLASKRLMSSCPMRGRRRGRGRDKAGSLPCLHLRAFALCSLCLSFTSPCAPRVPITSYFLRFFTSNPRRLQVSCSSYTVSATPTLLPSSVA